MSYRRLLVLGAIAAALLIHQIAAFASITPRIDPEDMKSVMLVRNVKPGMKGYGKTVFRGTEPETFQVEVLGVLDKANMGTELVVVKLSGGPMTSRGANLIEGMSGSPIYINGKILGAFAYGGTFGKEPIGLVTPLEYMLEAWDTALPSKPSTFYPFSTMNLDKPVALNGQSFGKIAITNDPPGKESFGSDTLVFQPLAMPVMVSGGSPRLVSRLQEQLGQMNVRVSAGPGLSSDKSGLHVDMQPGSAVGASFVTGDIDLTGVGTLTYRRGDKIVAFGHPMFGIGTIDAVLTSAYVYDVFPSYMVSSKIAAPIKPIGRVFQDRPWCIAGELGKEPEMIPVTVHVNNQTTGRNKDFKCKVINHPMLATMFIPAIAAEGIFETTGAPVDATARVKITVVAEEVGPITRENTYFDPMSIDSTAVTELQQILNMLRFNPFNPVSVERVDMWVDIVPEHKTARLERIFLKEGKYEPGDTVEVGAIIRPFQGERITKTLKIDLPRNMPNGQVTLMVSGGGASSSMPMSMDEDEMGMPMMMPSRGMSQQSSSADNLQQLVKKFLERDKNNELVARVVLPRPVPSIAGEKLSGLPPTIASVMRSPKVTAIAQERDEIKHVMPTDWVISGAQRLTITVQKADKREKRAPSAPSSQMPSESSSDDEDTPDAVTPVDSDELSTSTRDIFGRQLVSLAANTPSASAGQPSPTENSAGKPTVAIDSTVTESQPASSASSSDQKPIGRTATVWKQTARADFMAGTLRNTAATTGDLLILAGALEPLNSTGEMYVWCLTRDGKGNIYAGTGSKGIIYKIGPDGDASVLYDSPEISIHSLAVGPDGSVYAGSSPNGLVYKINPSGDASVLFDAEEKHITALTLDSKGNIYAATGDRCKVYKIAPDGTAETALDTSEFHALALAVDSSDNVYVGTGLNGIIYKVSADGAVTVIYDAAEESVTALAIDSKGALLAGTSPKGVIYKIAPGETPRAIYDKAGQGITGISVDGAGNIYAVNSAQVYEIMPDDTVCALGNDRDIQLLCITVDEGRLYAGTGNVGEIYQADLGMSTEGTLDSTIRDCGLTSQWGVVSWTADTPNGSSVTLQTRTGNVAEPDSTWSLWSAPLSTSGTKVMSPPGRYIQYRANLNAGGSASSPRLRDVSIVYLPENQAPKVTLTSPKGGEKWSKKKTVKWSASDPDKDTLVYDLFYSADGGATWKPIADRITSSAPSTEGAAPSEEPTEDMEEEESDSEEIVIEMPSPEQMLAEMAAELDKHPDIPQEIKDQIMAEAPAMIQAETEAMSGRTSAQSSESSSTPQNNGNNSTKQTSYSWDTAKFPDGSYLIKVVASDRLSNPTGALTAEAVSEPIILSNKPPTVVAFQKTVTVQSDRSVRVEGVAYHNLIDIAGVQYRIGSGDWMAAAADDGIFDTAFETFKITTLPLDKGEQTIEIKAVDAAGNASTTKTKVRVQ